MLHDLSLVCKSTIITILIHLTLEIFQDITVCRYARAPTPYMYSTHVRTIFITVITYYYSSLSKMQRLCVYFSHLRGYRQNLDNKEALILLLNDNLTILTSPSIHRKVKSGHS